MAYEKDVTSKEKEDIVKLLSGENNFGNCKELDRNQ